MTPIDVGGRRLQGQLCVLGAGKYPFRNVVLNMHVYRIGTNYM